MTFVPTQVVPNVTKVSAASVNTPNNEQAAAFNDHVSGLAWLHPAAAINVATQLNNAVMDNTAADLYTVINRFATAFFKAVNPDAANWATAINTLAATENVHDIYTLLRSHSHGDATTGGKLDQANTHQNADTDVSATSLHHTLGTGQFQAAAGNHTHAIYELNSNKNATNGYAGLSNGLIADSQISTNIARVSAMNAADNNLQTNINSKSAIGHTHGTAGEAQIAGTGIQDGAISALKIGNGVIANNHLTINSIASVNIQDKAVSAAKIADNTITNVQIANNTITFLQLADNALTTQKINDGAVTTAKISAFGLGNAAYATDSVDTRVLADNSVGTSNIIDASVTSVKILNGAVTDSKIQSGGLTGTSYGNASIDGGLKLVDYSVTQKKLAMGSITPTTPPSYVVNIAPMRKWNNQRNAIEYPGGTYDFTNSIPTQSGIQRYMGIGINSQGYVVIFPGDPTSGTPIKPQRYADVTGLGFVLLYTGMQSISTNDIYPWVGPDDGASGTGGSPIGHIHGQSNESRVGSIGLDEGFARPTDNPTLSVNVSGLHYRHSSGQTRYWTGGLMSFGPNAGGMQCIGVYFDTGSGQPVQIAGTVAASNPTKPSFIGDQRSLFYVFTRPNMAFVGAQDDGVNGWIEDARQWIGGGGGPSTVNTVPTGGTGVSSFVAGLVSSPGGTAALTSVPGPVGTIVGNSDAQTLTNKTFTNATVNTVGTIFKHIAGTNANLIEYQNSDGSIFGNVSRYNTFGFGAAETTGIYRVLIGGTIVGNATFKAAYGMLNNVIVQSFDNTAGSIGISNIAQHKANGQTNAIAYGIHSAPARAGGDTGTFSNAYAIYGTAPSFATNNYAGFFAGQVNVTGLTTSNGITSTADANIGGVTSFPSSPNANYTCYRSDLGCWFRHDGTAWRQIDIPSHATAPTAPFSGFRYTNLTDGFTYRWTGTVYVKQQSSVRQLNSILATATSWNGTTIASGAGQAFFGTAPTFTIEDSNSTIDVFARVAVLVGNASGATAQPYVFLQIASNNYTVAEDYMVTGTTKYMRGSLVHSVSLAAGSYSAQLWYLADQSTSVFCQPNLDPNRYSAVIQVLERKP